MNWICLFDLLLIGYMLIYQFHFCLNRFWWLSHVNLSFHFSHFSFTFSKPKFIEKREKFFGNNEKRISFFVAFFIHFFVCIFLFFCFWLNRKFIHEQCGLKNIIIEFYYFSLFLQILENSSEKLGFGRKKKVVERIRIFYFFLEY